MRLDDLIEKRNESLFEQSMSPAALAELKSKAAALGHKWPTFRPRDVSDYSPYNKWLYWSTDDEGEDRRRAEEKRKEIQQAVQRNMTASQWKHRNDKLFYDKHGNPDWAKTIVVTVVIMLLLVVSYADKVPQ